MNKKQQAGIRAAEFVQNGMTVGIGTGSTVYYVMQALKERKEKEGLCFTVVPSSFPTHQICRELDFDIKRMDDCERLDMAFDGADAIDKHLNAIKGGGAAQTCEKVFATMADKFILVADESKLVDELPTDIPIPVEVVPYAWRRVAAQIRAMGYAPILRNAKCKDGLVITENGNYVLDIKLCGSENIKEICEKISLLPGVLEVGLFIDIAFVACVGCEGGVKVLYSK